MQSIAGVAKVTPAAALAASIATSLAAELGDSETGVIVTA